MFMVRLARLLAVVAAVSAGAAAPASAAQSDADRPAMVHDTWYRLILELVRHTPTYSPPVASRALGYIGVAGYEVVASGDADMVSLAGQLNDLSAPPPREPGASYDEAVILQAALSSSVSFFFGNTGPTGQRAIAKVTETLDARVAENVAPEVAARSVAYGRAVAEHVIAWSSTDGGATVENMGFPMTYTVSDRPGAWKPTSLVRQQQAPLLPDWGRNRPFAMPAGTTCDLPPPPAYSEDPGSDFYAEAKEVYDVSRGLTAEQIAIARFWSDDPMLSSTPPGHWIAITRAVLGQSEADLRTRVDLMARVSIAMADAFIGCWHVKFRDNLVRPVTYIRATMDPAFTPLLNTPPFPEYPSGHSVQSAAAAAVLTAHFGPDFAFTDDSHADDGLPARSYPSFAAAAKEAALSRLYGGIHFRAAIERGNEQGNCIGGYAAALKTRK